MTVDEHKRRVVAEAAQVDASGFHFVVGIAPTCEGANGVLRSAPVEILRNLLDELLQCTCARGLDEIPVVDRDGKRGIRASSDVGSGEYRSIRNLVGCHRIPRK